VFVSPTESFGLIAVADIDRNFFIKKLAMRLMITGDWKLATSNP
jgi:hypothetical protein